MTPARERRAAREAAPLTGPLVNAAALAGLFLFGLLAIAASLAPTASRFAPDMLFCVLAVWAARRPGSTPALAVFALGLARDLLAGAPAGAGTLGLLVAVEGLRRAAPRLAARGRRGWLRAWGAVAAWAAVPILLPWALLLLTLAPTPPLQELALRYAATVLAFPVVALALGWAAPAAGAALRAEPGGGARGAA